MLWWAIAQSFVDRIQGDDLTYMYFVKFIKVKLINTLNISYSYFFMRLVKIYSLSKFQA